MGNANGNAHSLRRWLAAAALAGLSLTVHAFKADRYLDFAWSSESGGFTAYPASAGAPTWSSGSKTPTTGGPQWTGPKKQLPFQPSPGANFKATFSPANMAKSLMKPGLPLTFAAFSAVDYLLQQACTRIAGGVMQLSSSGAWEECNMVTTQQTIWSSSGAYNAYKASPLHATRVDACAPYAVGGHPGFPGDPYKFGCYSGANVIWSGYDIWYCPAGSPSNANQSWAKTASNSSTSYSCGTSLAEVQEGWKPATDSVAEGKLTTKLNDWTQADFLYGYSAREGFSTANVLDTLMNAGVQVEATLDKPTVETPIMEAPVQKTYTDPATGTRIDTTEQTQNDYDCVVISAGQAVKCSQYKKTTTTTATSSNPNGTGTVTTTATTVVNKTGEAAKGEQQDCPPGSDQARCSRLDAPTEAIPARTETLTYTAENLGFGGGSCPAPYAWTDSLGSHSINLAQFCSVLSSVVRPLVLALAALMAVFIVLPRET